MGITEFGGPEKLKLLDVPKPAAREKEILVRVKSAGINPVDWKIAEGHLQKALPHQLPIVLGWEAAGIVEEVGPGVRRFSKGDEVYAYCRKDIVQWGAYAEYIALPESSVAKKPKSLSFSEAATVPLAGLTAWQALFDIAKLQADETVLVHAGAGGVGGFALELAHWKRAHPITTAAHRNHEYVRNLGARLTIDYQTCDFRAAVREHFPEGVDVAIDAMGGETLRRTAEIMKKDGRLISIVDNVDAKSLGRPDISFTYHFVSPNGAQLEQLAHLIEDKQVTPHLTGEFPLDQAAKAHGIIRQGHVRGKLALIVSVS